MVWPTVLLCFGVVVADRFLKKCGNDYDYESTKCFGDQNQLRKNSMSVVLFWHQDATGTGWKWSRDLYITNAHMSHRSSYDIIFDYEVDCQHGLSDNRSLRNSKPSCTVTLVESGWPGYDGVHKGLPIDDWAVYRIQGSCPDNDSRNVLSLAGSKPSGNERINVVGHPQGKSKVVTRNEDGARCTFTTAGNGATVAEYRCDTDPGSSGSVIMNDSGKVIGLHRGGSCNKSNSDTNKGVSWDKLKDVVASKYSQEQCDARTKSNLSWSKIEEDAYITKSCRVDIGTNTSLSSCRRLVTTGAYKDQCERIIYGNGKLCRCLKKGKRLQDCHVQRSRKGNDIYMLNCLAGGDYVNSGKSGKCQTPAFQDPKYKYYHGVGAARCMDYCRNNVFCRGYSVSVYRNCLNWLEVVRDDGDSWGQAECIRKKFQIAN